MRVDSRGKGYFLIREKRAMLMVTFLLAGCALTPPPLAKEADERDAGDYWAFQNYVPTAYPVGSDAYQLERTLRSQGFLIRDVSASEFSAQDAVWYCDGGYFVKWSVDQRGRISTISARRAPLSRPIGLYCSGINFKRSV